MFGPATVLAALLGFAALASARMCPAPSMSRRQTQDPAFTIDSIELNNRLNCTNPGGLAAVRNPYLLVPGTGNNGTQSWQDGYVKLLTPMGYDVCYVSPPPFMLDDIQNNAEYIANAIDVLYTTVCRPFPIQGWSQGNLATQWVFTFFPSTRRKISHFLSLAGDFRGTTLGPLVDAVQVGGTAPSVIQQSVGSNFLAALAAKGGNYNWVPTTSISSRTDEIVRPQVEASIEGSTGFLGGSRTGNILFQDFCPLVTIGHGEQLYVNSSFQIIKLALQSSTRFASPAVVRTAVANGTIPCIQDDVAPGLDQADVASLQASFVFAGAVVLLPPNPSLVEPPLRSYVANTPDNEVHDA